MNASPSSAAAGIARALGRRLAAAGGLTVALVALLQHAPLWLACLRGGCTLLVLSFGARLGSAALARAIDCDHALGESKKEARS